MKDVLELDDDIIKKFVKDIDGDFNIPSYQRGYRWSKKHVLDLLKDLWEHSVQNSENEYCLQPVVISRNNIIDGQQRFTTIFIILKYLNEKINYTLSYETRTDSQSFLEKIASIDTIDETNPDYYHMSLAYFTIKEWFENPENKINKQMFIDTLLKKTFFVWYEVQSSKQDASDIFTRINTGKIPLTNAELVRAIFLKVSNFNTKDGFKTQERIANEWEEIEYALQNDEFWYFLCADLKQANHYNSRIEYILDILTKKQDFSEKNEFYTFNHYWELLHKVPSEEIIDKVEELWEDIKCCFNKFEEWFNDDLYYHYIGFIISLKDNSIKNIYIDSLEINKKSEFLSKIKEKIKKGINLGKINSLNDLNYGEHSTLIQKILLLFNIQSCAKGSKKFSFKDYKKKKPSLEHIHARASGDMGPKQMREWIEYHESFLKDKQDITNEIMKAKDNEIKPLFDDCFNHIYQEFNTNIENIDCLGNLALLDIGTNSALSNSVFPVKKQKITERKNGVPICTLEVFNKTYSKKDTGTKQWTQEDRKDYIKHIEDTIKEFIPNLIGEQ